MNYIRLKSDLRKICIEDRLKYNPSMMELHLKVDDLFQPQTIIDNIRYIKSKGCKVYIHHPAKFKNRYLDLISEDREILDYYYWSTNVLIDICKSEDTKLIIHAHYTESESSDKTNHQNIALIKKRLQHFQNIGGDYLLWENTIEGIFSYQNKLFLTDLVIPVNLSLCFDISHAFISFKGDNMKLKQALDESMYHVRYYHVVDSEGIFHDSLPLGQGKIDWRMVKPYLLDKDFIFEIDLKESNYEDCTPMVKSAEYLMNL